MALLQRRTVRATALLAAAERAERATARRQADAQTIGVKLPGVQGGQQRARRRAGLVLGRARQRAGRFQQRIGVQGGVQQMLVPEFVLRKCCAFFFYVMEKMALSFFFFLRAVCVLSVPVISVKTFHRKGSFVNTLTLL